jgi:hypothetical protein
LKDSDLLLNDCVAGLDNLRPAAKKREFLRFELYHFPRFEGREGDAVVSLRRRAFDKSRLSSILSANTKLQIQFQNDIYAKVCYLSRFLSPRIL